MLLSAWRAGHHSSLWLELTSAALKEDWPHPAVTPYAGWGPRQYDLRPRWNAATGDRSIEAVLHRSLSQWRSGVWFAGVVRCCRLYRRCRCMAWHNSVYLPQPHPSGMLTPCRSLHSLRSLASPQVGSDAPINYTLTISKYDCPGNCSSHGTCVPTGVEPPLRQCLCDEGFGGQDCSKSSLPLEYGVTVHQEPAAFEINYFSLPAPTGKYGALGAVGDHGCAMRCSAPAVACEQERPGPVLCASS